MSNWPRERREQLQELLQLLRLCESLNSSNHIIQNLGRVMELAQELTSFNRTLKRKSFTQFLVDEATKQLDLGDGEKEDV
jgi:hypothetical protein